MFEGWSIEKLREEVKRREAEASALNLEIDLRESEEKGQDMGIVRRNLKSEVVEISRMIFETEDWKMWKGGKLFFSPDLTLSIIKSEHHRNGISGTPFDVILFHSFDGDEQNMDKKSSIMLAIVMEGEGNVAVLDFELLSEGVIEFGQNSWRGDHYEPLLRKYLSEKGGKENATF